MKTAIKYLATIVVPVVLAWAFGYVRLPDSVSEISFTAGGGELISAKAALPNVIANRRPVGQLSLYQVRFANSSGRHIGNVRVRFAIDGSTGDLIASTCSGQEHYPTDLIKKIAEDGSSVTYEIPFINAQQNDSDLFVAGFLFAGPPPKEVIPLSLTPAVTFVSAKNSGVERRLHVSLTVGLVAFYSAFIWWVMKTDGERQRRMKSEFNRTVGDYLEHKLGVAGENVHAHVVALSALRDSAFSQEPWLKRKIKAWLGPAGG